MWPFNAFVKRSTYARLESAYVAQTQELLNTAGAHRVFTDDYIDRYRTVVRRVKPNNDRDWRIRVIEHASGRSVMNMAGPNTSRVDAVDRARQLPFPVVILE